ncbi:TRAP transporter large permease [Telmatospirillum sp. J64-1]|uniref:TRAP transporter large permease n=1 Tax=Telmatospirillum sp. J64-1 TaxID=2502183 RepID=UPI00115D08CC|nr:TRAP transporter large permease [Telmatospirillum sp. J64-1]
MEWYAAGGLLIGTVVCLMALGVPVAIAFMATNVIGTLFFIGSFNGLLQAVDNSTVLITSFQLVPVPMFILMGSLFFYSGLAVRVFDALDKLFGRIPGRLCFLTVAGGTTFSTLTGSSMANTAMLGSLLVPEMERRGYAKKMSIGPILGTGGLAMLIPPSTLGVLLASIAGVDVGRLLIAGIIPGLLLALLYVGMISLQVWRDPSCAPPYDLEPTPLREKLLGLVMSVLPMGVVVAMVVGFIIFGIATPTEAAAFGVLGVLILAALFRVLTFKVLFESLLSTVKVAGMVFFIIMNSNVFSQLLAFSGASSGMIGWVTGFDIPVTVVLLAMFAVLLLLGMFMDPVSMMLISVPVFFPLALTFGVDPAWFAIFMLLALEMSQTTPPFGLLLYIMLGVSPKGTTLYQVATAALPYLFCDAVLVGLILAFPMLVLWLPGFM